MNHDPSNLDAVRPPVVLDIAQLCVEFPQRQGLFRAVDGVSLQLRLGETLCLVGESGSGKSVTARAVLQIVDEPGRIASGQILFHRHLTAKSRLPAAGQGLQGLAADTVDITRLDKRSEAIRAVRGRDIAMIFQEPMSSLSPVHTIGNQIGEAILLHERVNAKEARRRVIELLRKVEIPDPEKAIDRYPFEYSGGMRQRAMIAMALACRPTILIADEPTTALDVTTQAEILALIRALQRENGMAVLFITHDMGVVAEIADEVAVMRHGQLVEAGSVLQIFEQPQHSYTQMLLGAVKHLDRPSARRVAQRLVVPPGEPLLRVKQLCKEFTASAGFFGQRTIRTPVVQDIDLELRAGENLGIVGESGSGKTTLVRCLLRAIDPTSGQALFESSQGEVDLVTVQGRQLRSLRKDMRMIFQDPFASLNPRMTVAQIVAEPLIVQGMPQGPELRRRVAELLDQVRLPPSAMERYPHAFSGGQRQRIGVARAIALKPRVIVADEATSALDVSIRTQVLDLLLELQETLGISYLFISHDIAVIRYFCDRVAVMYKGRIVEQGETESVCVHPQHAYTQALMSAIPHPDPRQRGLKARHRYTEPQDASSRLAAL